MKNFFAPTARAQAFHVPSTGFPQACFATLLFVLSVTLTNVFMAVAYAQTPATSGEIPATPDPGPIFRVFLNSGDALPSYGECAILGDRVVFTLVIGNGGLTTQYQLMSLPSSAVNIERTTRYRDAVRAARYAATRGETDFTAMTAEVSRSLDELARIPDPKARLAAAQEAKKRLLAWSEQNYRYRAKDIRELAGLFDDVIAQLQVAAGEARVSLDLVAGAPPEQTEQVRPNPTLRETIEMALRAVAASDVSTDRAAILRAAAAVSPELGTTDDLSPAIARGIADEQESNRAYAAFRADAMARAHLAESRGDVDRVTRVREETQAKGAALPAGHADELQALLADLDAIVVSTRDHRAALDRYTALRPQLLEYEKSLRPAVSSLDSTIAVLNAIHDMKGPTMSDLERASRALTRAAAKLAALPPPPETMTDVHATFISAVHLAQEACKREVLAIAANKDVRLSGEAAASAAGATMLVEQARANLIARLYPPKVR